MAGAVRRGSRLGQHAVAGTPGGSANVACLVLLDEQRGQPEINFQALIAVGALACVRSKRPAGRNGATGVPSACGGAVRCRMVLHGDVA
jgi:hypothetical protein